MKTKITLSIDSEVKKEIIKLAEKMWTNVSVMTNMFYVSALNTRSLHYYDFDFKDFWIKNTIKKKKIDYLNNNKKLIA